MAAPAESLANPNLRHLAAALDVRRLGSVSSAATQIHLSQSAVTQGIAKLEGELGVALFSRAATGMFVTPIGDIFLNRVARATAWLEQIDALFAAGARRPPRALHRLITSSQLRALIAVVERGSYTLAAHHLQLSQPTVHRAVRELESLCQQRFFQRSPAGVEASWQARQAARFAALFFAELRQGVEEVAEHQGQMAGGLRVGCLPLARTRLVPQAVTRLLAEYPEAQVSIIDGPYDEQLHSLRHGQLDLIVGALRFPIPSPDIVQELLFHDTLHLVVRPGHPLASRAAADIDELRGLDWIAPRLDTPAREAFIRFFADHGVPAPERVIECSSLVAIRSLLLDSDRVALLPARQVEVDVQGGLLAVSPQQLPGTRRDIGISRRQDWIPTKLQQRFIALLKEP